ncbi:LysM peptidoglycan-binding domain-containing protein [Roseospirillum parvum]|uniref:LysM domain-containing protein n=1 Tax=Roseospirillum parvum TaxID=83401 RepID=A0A1G8FML4_9PROT|nr:LysM peptidoglycan-binding domain-containing protein [Roseospirillum parvum]SDH83375.1 LysM domain-containing protein [Roseospirillum parvum]
MTRAVILGGLAVVAALTALGLFLFLPSEPERAARTASPAPPTVTPAPPATSPAPVAETPAPAPPAREAPDRPPGTPSFDVARVDDQGNLVVAGRAAPDSEVTVSIDGEPKGTARTDARGEFVFLPDQPLPPGPHQLTLSARPAAPTSEADAAGEVPDTPPAEPAPGDGAPIAGDEVVVLEVPQPLARPGAPRPPTLPTVKLGQGGTTLMSPGGSTDGPTVGLVDYDRDGRLRLSGQAPPGAQLRAYLDNRLLGETTADAQGHWEISPKVRAAEGPHTLRLDQVDPEGKVIARRQVPFEMTPFAQDTLASDAPATATPAEAAADRRIVVIQPGNNLWRIAQRVYGSGFDYTIIYRANSDQIRDPDLIYPGQVFDLPPEG